MTELRNKHLNMEVKQWINLFLTDPLQTRYFLKWKRLKQKTSDNQTTLEPWITFRAKQWLDNYLTRKMKIFEWGSGGSTVYLTKKVAKLVSVEHDPVWHKETKTNLGPKNKNKLKYFLIEPEKKRQNVNSNIPGGYKSSDFKDSNFKNYCQKIADYPDGYFDLVIVDGRARVSSIFHAISKVKPGCFLMLDNSERKEYLPGISLLKKWPRKNFFGPGPHNSYFWQTSIFKKPL